MSHSKIRSEKICLNCGSPVPERYCTFCGQENIEPRQSVGHLVTHFFSDITHFDGKFFATVKDLFRRPGFLSREYMMGRRMSYLDPIRMYIFTSAFFFIIFFSMFDLNNFRLGTEGAKFSATGLTLHKALENAKTAEDSANIRNAFAEGGVNNLHVSYRSSNYRSLAQYDSVQQALPAKQRDGWLKRIMKRKNIEIDNKYHNNKSAFLRNWIGIFLHNFPKFLFLSLPVFALLLKLLYVRKRKQFYYVDHGIFAVHLYIFSFLVLLLYFGLLKLQSVTGWAWLPWLEFAIFSFSLWYFYKAMRNFYRQDITKTLVKYFLLLLLSSIVQLTLFVFYVLFSLLEV
ncbi:MAG: DUF3667 domain-containing protein [Bacteroidota bacterium]|nr:DUF3667 domain-containing protein [Bacteroidota bacterium]MDP4249965.1 DUF3667 domain-containing protein [Bacteroidota bacterium]